MCMNGYNCGICMMKNVICTVHELFSFQCVYVFKHIHKKQQRKYPFFYIILIYSSQALSV